MEKKTDRPPGLGPLSLPVCMGNGKAGVFLNSLVVVGVAAEALVGTQTSLSDLSLHFRVLRVQTERQTV